MRDTWLQTIEAILDVLKYRKVSKMFMKTQTFRVYDPSSVLKKPFFNTEEGSYTRNVCVFMNIFDTFRHFNTSSIASIVYIQPAH